MKIKIFLLSVIFVCMSLANVWAEESWILWRAHTAESHVGDNLVSYHFIEGFNSLEDCDKRKKADIEKFKSWLAKDMKNHYKMIRKKEEKYVRYEIFIMGIRNIQVQHWLCLSPTMKPEDAFRKAETS